MQHASTVFIDKRVSKGSRIAIVRPHKHIELVATAIDNHKKISRNLTSYER